MASTSRPPSVLRQAARLLSSRTTSATSSPRKHLQTSASFWSSPSPSPSSSSSSPSPHSQTPNHTKNPIHQNAPDLSTVNQTEVSHFDALASTWWDSHGPSRLLHLMNPLRHDFIRACHASEPSTSEDAQPPRHQQLHYLDVGCGGGIFAESAARLPSVASVTALDASASVLAVARDHLRREPPAVQQKLTYLHSSVEALAADLFGPVGSTLSTPERGGRFDVVTTFEVLEHVENPSAFLERCGALVRPGGWLVLSTMARTWASWATTILAAEHVLGIVPPGTHDWNKYVDVGELRAWFGRRPAHEGWGGPGSITRCQGVVYVPGLGWKEVPGSEKVGNYFFAARKSPNVE